MKENYEGNSRGCFQRASLRLKLEAALVCTLLVIIWGLLSLPIVFYFVPVEEILSDENSNATNASINNGSSTCKGHLQFLSVESVCYQELEMILETTCPQDLGESIVVQRDESEMINVAIQGLNFVGASQECRKEVVPLLCQYFFGVCSDSGVLVLPTSSECERIKRVVCPREWETATQLGFDLPDCVSLPSQSSCLLNPSEIVNNTDLNLTEIPLHLKNTTRLNCSTGFFRDNDSILCLPSCYSWTENSRELSKAIDVIVCMVAVMGFIGSIIVIVASILRHERMLVFPSIVIVYMVIDLLVLSLLGVISFMDRPGLYCSSRSLLESLGNVSVFCIISGMCFTYGLLQLSVWWFIHTGITFWKAFFPFHSRSFEVSGRMKYVHAASLVIGMLFPFLPVVTSMVKFAVDVQQKTDNSTSSLQLFLSGGLGFSVSRFPPILCTASDPEAVFYTLVLPIDIILLVGCSFLLIIFWSIHRRSQMKEKEKSNRFQLGAAEKKLLVVFCYYIILASVALTSFTLSIRNLPSFLRKLQTYFLCEQRGHDPSNPCSRVFQEQSYPLLATASFILLGMFPVVNMLYAVNLRDLKEILKKWRLKNRRKGLGKTRNSSAITVATTLSKSKPNQ